MNGYFINIISIFGFIIMILTLCSFGVKYNFEIKNIAGLLLTLPVYSLLPMGSLPPFFRYQYGFPLLIVLVCVGAFTGRERLKKIPFALSLVIFYAALYFYAPKTGMPGNIYGTSSCAAWSVSRGYSIYAKAAMILFFIGFCLSALTVSEDDNRVQKLFPYAFIVSFFFHINYSWKLHITGIFAYICDMILFWAAVYALYLLALMIKEKIKNERIKKIIFILPFTSSLFGALLLSVDYALF